MHLAKIGMATAAPPGASTAKELKLKRSAHEFEASLMAELLKPLQETGSLTGETSDNDEIGSGSALQDFASESLAKAISERGGFGIAERILRQLDAGLSIGALQEQKTPAD